MDQTYTQDILKYDIQVDCKLCGKKLRAFKVHLDWQGRMLHKSCWKKEQDRLAWEIYLDTFK